MRDRKWLPEAWNLVSVWLVTHSPVSRSFFMSGPSYFPVKFIKNMSNAVFLSCSKSLRVKILHYTPQIYALPLPQIYQINISYFRTIKSNQCYQVVSHKWNSETCLGSTSLNLPAPIARSISITEGRRGFGFGSRCRRRRRGLLIGIVSAVPLVLGGGEWDSWVGLIEATATFLVTEMQKQAIFVQSFFFLSIYLPNILTKLPKYLLIHYFIYGFLFYY